MDAIEIDPQRVICQLRELAAFGRCGTGVDRRALTQADLDARRWLIEQMRAAGLESCIDAVGNVVGRTPHARRIVVGSHTDTVPKGGWLDGALGVIAGLEAARAVASDPGRFQVGVEVISFSDEEGRFHPFLGSRSFCAEADDQSFQGQSDGQGSTVGGCLSMFPEAVVPPARLDRNQHLAFLELHIEQGPVLEASGVNLGVVTAIVGVRQARVTFVGQANHAGTTPMALRRDAAKTLYNFAVDWSRACKELAAPTTVWNLGQVSVDPGVANVVAGRAVGICQYRDVDAGRLERITAALEDCARTAAAACGTEAKIELMYSSQPTGMDPSLMRILADCAVRAGATCSEMPSGAGHDAMILGRYVPAGMLFVPSRNGLSHSIEEDTSTEDLCRGISIFGDVVKKLCDRPWTVNR